MLSIKLPIVYLMKKLSGQRGPPAKENCDDIFKLSAWYKQILSSLVKVLAFFSLTIFFKISAGIILNIKDDVRALFQYQFTCIQLIFNFTFLGPHI